MFFSCLDRGKLCGCTEVWSFISWGYIGHLWKVNWIKMYSNYIPVLRIGISCYFGNPDRDIGICIYDDVKSGESRKNQDSWNVFSKKHTVIHVYVFCSVYRQKENKYMYRVNKHMYVKPTVVYMCLFCSVYRHFL